MFAFLGFGAANKDDASSSAVSSTGKAKANKKKQLKKKKKKASGGVQAQSEAAAQESEGEDSDEDEGLPNAAPAGQVGGPDDDDLGLSSPIQQTGASRAYKRERLNPRRHDATKSRVPPPRYPTTHSLHPNLFPPTPYYRHA